MRRGLGTAALALLGALLLPPARAEEPPQATAPEPVRYADAKKQNSFFLPPGWKAKTHERRLLKGCVISLDVQLEGQGPTFFVELYHLPGLGQPLPQSFLEKPVLWKRENADDATVLREPRPHLRLDLHRGEDPWVRVHAYHLIEGRGFTLVIECPPEVWPRASAAFFAAVDTIETRLGPYPARPKDYERLVKDGYVYYVHPLAKKADVKAYHAYLRKMEKEFRKRHGRFPKQIPHELSIVFHPSKAMAAAFDQDAGGNRSGHGSHILKRRLFATPLDLTDNAVRCDVRMYIWGLFLYRRYGCSEPGWMYDGETLIQYVQGAKGAPLPAATDWLLDQPDPPQAPFTIGDPDPTEDGTVFRKRQALYMALFQAGPAKYRKAYKRCLKAIGDGEDWTEAATEHLLSLDAAKMTADAAAFLAKMRKASGK